MTSKNHLCIYGRNCQQRMMLCRLDLYRILIFSIAIISVVYATSPCRLDDATDITGPCGENESCWQTSKENSTAGSCKCKPGYERTEADKVCRYAGPPSTARPDAARSTYEIDDSSGSKTGIIFAGIFIVLIAGIVAGLVYAEKRYGIVSRIRNRLQRQNRLNYDEVMIGRDDDDPPIA